VFKYTKRDEINPHEKQNGASFFSPLGQYSKKSKTKKAPASVESRMGGRKKKCGINKIWPLDPK
jgi:hypothetical protein